MGSLELANDNTPGMGGTSMADMPGMAMPDQKIAPEITIPGFPKPGLYRVFFQFKRADTIETAVFDTTVE